MRTDKNNPGQVYADFWDWLRTDWHPLWVVSTVFAYMYYLMTTEEV